jgi:hypothetical protein
MVGVADVVQDRFDDVRIPFGMDNYGDSLECDEWFPSAGLTHHFRHVGYVDGWRAVTTRVPQRVARRWEM